MPNPMSTINRSSADLAYRYLPEHVRGDVESMAFDMVRESWQQDRPDDFETLQAAHENTESAFEWTNIEFETDPQRDDYLAPLVGVVDDGGEIRDLARDFAWELLDEIRDKITRMQTDTDFSAKQFLTLILDADPHVTEDVAAAELGISVGNYRGKKGDVNEKIETAKATVHYAEELRDQ